jgi:cobalt/nickel transport system permease protein
VLLVSPFAILVGAFNPLLDRAPLGALGPLALTGGWVSFASILVRFVLTVSAALLLVATTGFDAVCAALARLRVPRALVVQLLFMYRYLFVLSDEVSRTSRAFALRSPGKPRPSPRAAGTLLGQILLRTLQRAERVHTSMVCRGFDGQVRLQRPMRWRASDAAFVTGWSAFFVLVRTFDLPRLLGVAITGSAG